MNNENNNINNNTVTPVPSTVLVTNINQASDPVIVPSTEIVAPSEPQIVQQNVAPAVEILQPTQPVITPQPVQTPTPVVEVPNMQMPTEPVTTPAVVQPQEQTDPNAMVNENLKKVEIKDYTPPSKLKVAGLLIFFGLLIAFIIFLPQISSMVRVYMSGQGQQTPVTEVITTGRLICSMSTNTKDLDKEYEFTFRFTDNKLKSTKYISNTRGDSTTENSLDILAEKCNSLKENTAELEGVSIKCNYTDGRLTETQSFELETVDPDELNAAFTEAGGILPSYKLDQDIDEIEKNMKASSYSCERQN